MTLLEVVRRLEEFDEEGVIHAKEPWHSGAEAVVVPDCEDEAAVVEAERQGFAYFLEVEIAREFLEGWADDFKTSPQVQEICDRVIYYATYDA